MNKEFKNKAFQEYCAFNDDGIVWHSNRPKQIAHLFFPYGSIDSIKFPSDVLISDAKANPIFLRSWAKIKSL